LPTVVCRGHGQVNAVFSRYPTTNLAFVMTLESDGTILHDIPVALSQPREPVFPGGRGASSAAGTNQACDRSCDWSNREVAIVRMQIAINGLPLPTAVAAAIESVDCSIALAEYCRNMEEGFKPDFSDRQQYQCHQITFRFVGVPLNSLKSRQIVCQSLGVAAFFMSTRHGSPRDTLPRGRD
jgi:hypothetical protein